MAAVARHLRPMARIAYVMTDGAALPLALSRPRARPARAGVLDATVTAGHAFGGDLEAVAVPSALALARHVAGADLVVVGMGPGVVGTGSPSAPRRWRWPAIIDAAARMGAAVAPVRRASDGDARERHRGVSHHVRDDPRPGGGAPRVPAAAGARRRPRRSDRRSSRPTRRVLRRRGLRVTTMGRGPDEDPLFFAAAGPPGPGRPPLDVQRGRPTDRRSSLGRHVRGEAGTPAQPDGAPARDPAPARRREEIRDAAGHLSRRDRRLPPGVRARQGRPAGHGRAARGRGRARRRPGRRGLPHPQGPLLPAAIPGLDPRRAGRPAPGRLAGPARGRVGPRGPAQARRAGRRRPTPTTAGLAVGSLPGGNVAPLFGAIAAQTAGALHLPRRAAHRRALPARLRPGPLVPQRPRPGPGRGARVPARPLRERHGRCCPTSPSSDRRRPARRAARPVDAGRGRARRGRACWSTPPRRPGSCSTWGRGAVARGARRRVGGRDDGGDQPRATSARSC